jgi:hypothetical protein
MKKQRTTFFANLFGAKGKPAESVKTTPVVITSYSQPHVLQQRMKEEQMTHGETVTANISPVRLENAYGKMVMYFCPMQTLEVLNHQAPAMEEISLYKQLLKVWQYPATRSPVCTH